MTVLLEDAVVSIEDAAHQVDLLFKARLELLKCGLLVQVLLF